MTLQSFLKVSLFSFLAIGLDSKGQAMSGLSVQGLWKTQDGRAKVNIHPCPHATDRLCGTIVELREPLDPQTGKEKTDQYNSEENLKGRKLNGLMNLMDFKAVPDEPFHWVDGKIYSPREGKTYSSELELSPEGNILTVRGYVGLPIFGQTQTWTRTTPEDKLIATPASE